MSESATTRRRLESLRLARRADRLTSFAARLRRGAGVLALLLGLTVLASLPAMPPPVRRELEPAPPRGQRVDDARDTAASAGPTDRAPAATTAAGGVREPEAVLTATGFVVPADGVVEVAARSSGEIAEVRVIPGQHVAAGELLFRLDDRAARVALAQVRARLASALAERTFARSRRARAEQLREAGILAREEWERETSRVELVEAQVREHEAALARHRLELEFTMVRAPRAGVVLEVRREVGEVVFATAPEGVPWVVAIADLDELRVAVDVHEADLAELSPEQPALVVLDVAPGRTYQGRVASLGPRVNRQKGTVPVEVAILDPDRHLRPDASARVRFLPLPGQG